MGTCCTSERSRDPPGGNQGRRVTFHDAQEAALVNGTGEEQEPMTPEERKEALRKALAASEASRASTSSSSTNGTQRSQRQSDAADSGAHPPVQQYAIGGDDENLDDSRSSLPAKMASDWTKADVQAKATEEAKAAEEAKAKAAEEAKVKRDSEEAAAATKLQAMQRGKAARAQAQDMRTERDRQAQEASNGTRPDAEQPGGEVTQNIVGNILKRASLTAPPEATEKLQGLEGVPRKGARLLRAGLKSGEVGQLVKARESEKQAPEAAPAAASGAPTPAVEAKQEEEDEMMEF